MLDVDLALERMGVAIFADDIFPARVKHATSVRVGGIATITFHNEVCNC